MEFLAELHEARMTRDSSNQKVLTYTDCCERLYLSLLSLELLRRYPQFAPLAHGYAKKTTDRDSYKHFRMYATDLYNFAHFVTGDADVMKKLKDPKSAMAVRAKTTLPVMAFNRYLMGLASGRASNMNDQAVFVSIENSLNIVNIKDPEPTVSIPDISVQGRDLALYRYLVGTDNIMLTKKFIELAKQGKPVAPQFVQAYLPAIKMIDNIVKGGPAFVSMLRTLEKRAKTQHKK
jgi:hypothetical protein